MPHVPAAGGESQAAVPWGLLHLQSAGSRVGQRDEWGCAAPAVPLQAQRTLDSWVCLMELQQDTGSLRSSVATECGCAWCSYRPPVLDGKEAEDWLCKAILGRDFCFHF